MYTLLLGIIKIIIPTLYTSISITDSKGNLILHLDSPKTGTFIWTNLYKIYISPWYCITNIVVFLLLQY
jgi:hypothetical protein